MAMVVGAAGNKAEAALGDRVGHSLGVCRHLLLVLLKSWFHRFFQAYRLRRNDVYKRASLRPRKVSLSISLANAERQSTKPPRGPRSVLCVVVETMSACGTGLECTPAATRPAICAMSTKNTASTDLAIFAMRSKSMTRGYALAPATIILGLCWCASCSISS